MSSQVTPLSKSDVAKNSVPKLFISYVWSNPKFENEVLSLATKLRTDGVDVILDKWDLKHGHDSAKFMEQMVADTSIKKVAILCTKEYVEKANNRLGGVGTETQIISGEVFKQSDQEKFVCIVMENDENGEACVPIYYGKRIYIDLTQHYRSGEQYEKLLRWIFDRPLYVKPDIGKEPSFLGETVKIISKSKQICDLAFEAIKNNRPDAFGNFHDYCVELEKTFCDFEIVRSPDPFDEDLIKNIDQFLPFRDEFLLLVKTMAIYMPELRFIERIHKFFEGIIPKLTANSVYSSGQDRSLDNYKFLGHELFLNTIAILIKYEKFEFAGFLLNQRYYSKTKNDYTDTKMNTFYNLFNRQIGTLDDRNKRLSLRRLSLHADLLKNRLWDSELDFEDVLQADFVAFIRSELDGPMFSWWPVTLVYINEFSQKPFEIFFRAESKAYFEKIRLLFSVDKKEDFEALIQAYSNGRNVPRWEFKRIIPQSLMGYENLASLK